MSSWWPTTSDVEEEVSSESWWPTNPVVIDSLEAKSPPEFAAIDWSFLDSEYPDPPPQSDNQGIQILGEITSSNVPQNMGSMPRYSTSNTNDMQTNMLRSARTSNIEGLKVQSRQGSLSVIETIKEMTT